MNPFEEYRVSSPFGIRIDPLTGSKSEFHTGIDLVKAYQGVIYAFAAGEVVHAKEGATGSGFGGYGNVVAIKDANGRLHCYCHLYCCLAQVGAHVSQGALIGRQGGKPGDQGAGKSTGSHLHYEIRKTSAPSYGWIADRANNCLDPTKYLLGLYSKGVKPKMEPKQAVDKVAAQKVIDCLGTLYTASADKDVQAAAHYAADALRDAAEIAK